MTNEQTLRELAVKTDTTLAELDFERAKYVNYAYSEKRTSERYSKRPDTAYNRIQIQESLERLAKLNEKIAEYDVKIKPLNDIYMEHGWARYYYVPAGHVHNRYCSTLRVTTTVYWLPEYADMPVDELIEKAGDRACTVCFPDAPVDKPTTLEVYTQVQDAKAKRANELAEKRAKAYAEAIKDVDGEVVFKSMRAANTIAGRDISSIVYFYGYVPEFYLLGVREKNNISKEEHFKRWDNSGEITRLNRDIAETIALMEANGGDDAMEKAMKRFEKEVNSELKRGHIFPEDFNLEVFKDAGMTPTFKVFK